MIVVFHKPKGIVLRSFRLDLVDGSKLISVHGLGARHKFADAGPYIGVEEVGSERSAVETLRGTGCVDIIVVGITVVHPKAELIGVCE